MKVNFNSIHAVVFTAITALCADIAFAEEPQWIWGPGAEYNCFRKTIAIPDNPRAIRVRITADDRYVLYLNGDLVGYTNDYNDYHIVEEYEITRSLLAEDNTIAIIVYDTGGAAGVIAAVEAVGELSDPVQYVTDNSWRVSANSAPGWMEHNFNDAGWQNASVVRGFSDAPWYINQHFNRETTPVVVTTTPTPDVSTTIIGRMGAEYEDRLMCDPPIEIWPVAQLFGTIFVSLR